MKALTLFFALIVTTSFSCSKEEEEALTLRTTAPAQIVQVDVPEKTLTAGESTGIKVFFLVNNGCGEFGSFEAAADGNTITVKVYPHYREGFCTQAITTREAIYAFAPESAGTYTLKFWAGEDEFITKTVVVQ